MRDKINANVLGKKNKDNRIHKVEVFVRLTSFSWLVIWIIHILFYNTIFNIMGVLYINRNISYIGLFINTLGVLVFAVAAFTMKSSWRVGIDKDTKSNLVKDGIYKYSRNPAFVGFDLMFIGLFITYPNILTLINLVLNLVSFHLLILQEEKHLYDIFGREYALYKEKTPRYI
jgi:protein-S-isoprenylcysteine O-methyltransferase Ste14